MIKFSLKCSQSHSFESWFSGNSDYERLRKGNLLSCPICGDTNIQKHLMAPNITAKDNQKPAATPVDQKPPSLAEPPHPLAAKMREMQSWMEKNSEDVGKNFATEARAIHNGEAKSRVIHGEAKLEEAKALADDGVPVAPLPFPVRKLS